MAKFTKIPNHVLDSMGELSPAAFKVAMALYRQTVGFHRDSVKLSISKLSKMTGLSRQGVVNAVDQVAHLFTRAIDGRTTIWTVNSVDQSAPQPVNSVDNTVLLSSTGYTTELYDNVPLSSTITSGLKKKENIKESIKEDDPIEKLETEFTNLTGCFSAGSYTDDWKPVLEYWHNAFGADAVKMMKRAVEFARGDNPQARQYTIRSPKSISTIMANMPRGERRMVKQESDGGFYV